MSSLVNFFQIYRSGIFLLLLFLAGIAFLIQWLAWIFGVGRFKNIGTASKTSSFIFSEFTFKIINEFRHLLALLVVLIFSFALGYSLIKAASLPADAEGTSVIDNMKEALQAVVATLGGLVGSIIGYYFGESSVSKPVLPATPLPPPDTKPIQDTIIPVTKEESNLG
jgi:hypothetical protein